MAASSAEALTPLTLPKHGAAAATKRQKPGAECTGLCFVVSHHRSWLGLVTGRHEQAPAGHSGGTLTVRWQVQLEQQAPQREPPPAQVRAAAALAGASGACTASAPCFSPPMSALSPATMITYIDSAANRTKPTIIFHITISLGPWEWVCSIKGPADTQGYRLYWVRGTSPLMEHRARPLRVGPCTPVGADRQPHRATGRASRISRWRRCPRPWFP